MKNKMYLLFMAMFLASSVKADLGSFDLVKIKFQENEFYVTVFNVGALMENGLCYKTWEEEELNMKEHLLQQYSRYDSIVIHKRTQSIPFEKLGIRIRDQENQLVMVGQAIKISKEAFSTIEVESAITGNTFGYTYSTDLVTEDISWIKEYPLEKLFYADREGMCEYTFYGIKGNYSKADKKVLKRDFMKHRNEDGLIQNEKEVLSALYKKHIFMVGVCSC